jgi:ubiquinone/menaquinone biosynthesis C-methylase UbiE
MKDDEITKLYSSDQYLKDNPDLFEIDIPFKLNNILPYIDKFAKNINKNEIDLLDVGGGNGIILKRVSDYITNTYGIIVNKYIIDLSPGMILKQCNNNPDIKKCLNENICKTSFGDNEFDLTLMIDVLEHVPQHDIALKELNRISNFVLFKVPLEKNLFFDVMNLITLGKSKELNKQNGHINLYSPYSLKVTIETFYGKLIGYNYTNMNKELYQRKKYSSGKNIGLKMLLIYYIASKTFYFSPKFMSLIITDFIMVLAEAGK